MGYVFKDRALLQVKYKFSDLPGYQGLFFPTPGARDWGGRTRKEGPWEQGWQMGSDWCILFCAYPLTN